MRPKGKYTNFTVAVLTAAAVGSALAALLLLGWPRPLFDWIRVIPIDSGDRSPTATELAAFLAFSIMLLSVLICGVRALLRLLGVSRSASALALVMIVVFVVTFGAEAADQLMRASGNLTASDAAGFMIEDGRLTRHGWETIARRAAAASLLAGITAAAFKLVRSVQERRGAYP